MADNLKGLKTGIFGGAFNPVHNGHINLAKCCLDALELDRIFFIPTAQPPHKTSRYLVSKEDRLKMLELAIQNNKRFEISDIEFNRKGKSYTYDTLCLLKEMYPADNFYLIIGTDQFLTFDKWYRYEDILSAVTLCTGARNDSTDKQKILEFADKLNILHKDNFNFISGDILKISSSEIRDMFKNSSNASAYLPSAVYDYITERNLYSV